MEDFNQPSPEDFNQPSPEDFNQPSPERIDLLERLQKEIGSVTPHFWAACQICDLGALVFFLHREVFIVRGVNIQSSQMIRHWGLSPGMQSRPSTPKTPTSQKSTLSNSSPSTYTLPPPSKRQKILASPTTLPRDMNIKKRAEERDNFSCVLTGIKMIEVAHIYPHHSMKQKEEERSAPRHAFWDILRAFWSEEKVTTWEAKLFPQGISEKGQEEVYNLISLAPTVHAIWGRGLFALRPVSESNDKKTLTVQFFWQKKQENHSPKVDLTTTPTSTKGLEQTAGVWLFDKNGKKIQSGDYFDLQTVDPIQKPLPSFELLELQWFLHRIQGMAGAADIEWPSLSDSGSDISDSDISDLELPDLELWKEDLSLLSSQPLSSPVSPVYNNNSNLPVHPKHQEAEVDGAGEGGRDLALQRERGY